MKKLVALALGLTILTVPIAQAGASATEGETWCFVEDGRVWFVSRLHTFGNPVNFELEGREKTAELSYFHDIGGYRVMLHAISGGDWWFTFRSKPRDAEKWVLKLYVREGASPFRRLIGFWKKGVTTTATCGSAI